MTSINHTMPLGEQLAHIAVFAAVCAWIARLWTDKGGSITDYLERRLNRCNEKLFSKNGTPTVNIWLSRVGFRLLTYPTHFVHLPILFFIATQRYTVMTGGPVGAFYCWMLTASTSDTMLTLMNMLSKTETLEEQMAEGLKYGVEFVKKKVIPPEKIRWNIGASREVQGQRHTEDS
jgi:hypothetical protein